MNIEGKGVSERAYRYTKEYPGTNNTNGIEVVKGIYYEYGIVTEEQELGDAKSELIGFLGQEKAQEVMQRPLYQSITASDFIKNPQKYVTEFSDLFSLYKKNVSGKGEVIPLVAIKGAKTGGNLEKDIITPDGTVIEVKDLVSGTEFSTASKGNPKGTIFAEHLETFMKYLAAYDTSGKYKELVDYYLANWQRGNLKGSFFKDLVKVIAETKSSAETYEYIKVRGKRYVIMPGKECTISIDVEGNLTTELPQAEEKNVASIKLVNHPWVQDVGTIEKELKALQEKALEGIDYFLLYRNQMPIIVAKKDFNTTFTFLRFALSSLRLVYNVPGQ